VGSIHSSDCWCSDRCFGDRLNRIPLTGEANAASTVVLREPWPCDAAADSDLRALLRCSEGLPSQAPSSRQGCSLRRDRRRVSTEKLGPRDSHEFMREPIGGHAACWSEFVLCKLLFSLTSVHATAASPRQTVRLWQSRHTKTDEGTCLPQSGG